MRIILKNSLKVGGHFRHSKTVLTGKPQIAEIEFKLNAEIHAGHHDNPRLHL